MRLPLVIAGAIAIAPLVSCAADPHARARDYVARADRSLQEGRIDAAIIDYRNAAREWPEWGEAHRKLGLALERDGRTAEAYRAYAVEARIVDGQPLPHDEDGLRAVMASHPKSVAARVALADLLLSRGDTPGGESMLLEALDLEPSNELANRALAALYLDAGRLSEAESLLDAAAAQEPQRYRSRLALADFLLSQERYAEARGWLDRARDDALLENAVRLRLAAIDYEEGKREAARDAVSAIIAGNATAADAWALRAEFRFKDGDFTNALADAREALALEPDLVAAQNLADAIRAQQLRK
jgi:tetratricopeptide (TPR) repeat protein